MTYYHISEKNKNKIYLFSYIKDHPDYQKVKFWEDYLNELIGHEIKGNVYHLDMNLENKTMDNLNKEEKEKLSNCYFSNFLTVVKAMADFRLDRQFVRDFVEKNKDKYFLSKEHIKSVCMIFDVSLNENEVSYNGDILNKEIKNLKNDNKDLNKHNYEELVANDNNNNNNEEVNKEININQNINEINKINIEKKNEDEKYIKIEENEKKKKIDENKNNDIILNKNNVIIEEDKKYEN